VVVERADLVVGVGEVREVADHLTGDEPALQHLVPCRERDRVQALEVGLRVGAGLDREQAAVHRLVELAGRDLGARDEHPLPDGELVAARRRADPRLVDRDVADEEQVQTVFVEGVADHCVDDGQLRRVGPQVRTGGDEEVADAEQPRRQVGATGQLAEERRGQVDPDPAAVTDAL
jgi:hypothetical protein